MSKVQPDGAERLVLLPLRRGVLLPGAVLPVPVGRPRSLAAFDSLKAGDEVAVAVQLDAEVSDPMLQDLHRVATRARIHRIQRREDGRLSVVLEGLHRVRLEGIDAVEPTLKARVRRLADFGETAETRARFEALVEHGRELVGDKGGALEEALRTSESVGASVDKIAAVLDLSHSQEVELLVTTDVDARVRLVTERVREARDYGELRNKMRGEVRRRLEKQQKEVFLREQIRALQSELGKEEGEEEEKDKLETRLRELALPEEARVAVDRELKRLASLPESHPEANVARTYLELIADLPWNARVEVHDDLDGIEAQLDADHHGLADVKQRILEHMAVLKLGGNRKGTVLCLAGPPGVGKTSLGQSIADATGRPFIRIALGGVRDEAELRGHRRTYVGALPGRLLSALRKAKVRNPVILLDEVDKLSTSYNGGAPESALLEILDPEQNHTFTDHYLDLEFDLSEVTFIATANDLSRMSAPLRDRLEIIELSGYTRDEKRQIARKHLVSRALGDAAVPGDALEIEDAQLGELIDGYTREAGVRQLTRELGKVARAVALEIARRTKSDEDETTKTVPVKADADFIRRVLGRPRFRDEVAERTAVPGVATGLAWTPVGGDILFVEASRMPGKGQLQITGQLGDVMKESARAALSYVRAHAESLGIDGSFLEREDVHLHVPAGAVPKDGPSAGVTMYSALTSSLTGRRVRSDTAMTGEVTLRGRVLPVGGIKAKVLAAHRAGIRRIVLPKRNEVDIDDVPEAVREQVEFIPVEDMHEVLEAVLESEVTPELEYARAASELGSGRPSILPGGESHPHSMSESNSG